MEVQTQTHDDPAGAAPSLEVERDRVLLRAVVDGVQHCNLRCLYCRPGEVWRRQHRDAERNAAVFAAAEANLGVVTRQPAADLLATLPGRFVPDACSQCMPSSRTANSAAHKLLTDLRHGWQLDRQPFADAPGQRRADPDPVRPLLASR